MLSNAVSTSTEADRGHPGSLDVMKKNVKLASSKVSTFYRNFSSPDCQRSLGTTMPEFI